MFVSETPSRGFLSLDPTTPAWETELILMNHSDQALSKCDVLTLTLLNIIFIFSVTY